MRAKDIALIGVLSATVTTGKLALSFMPNVEVVTLLFIVYTVILGIRRSLVISVIFSTTEILIYGFSTWLLVYYFIWPLLIVMTGAIKNKVKTEYGYATLAGIFGLIFGTVFAVVESLFYGLAYGFSYWIKGLPLDMVHGFSNFLIVLVLFKPLIKVLSSVNRNDSDNKYT